LVLGSFPTTISDIAPGLASMSFSLPTCDKFFHSNAINDVRQSVRGISRILLSYYTLLS
jgi:hypothetical protein